MSARGTRRHGDRRDIPGATAVALASREESLARFMATLPQASSAGMCFLDLDWRFVYINDVLARINGFPVETHIGRFVGDLLPDLWRIAEPVFRRVRDTGEPVSGVAFTAVTPANPGDRGHWLESLFPVFSETGLLLGVGAIVQELSDVEARLAELRRTEERFRVAQELSLDGFTILTALRDECGGITDFVCEYANPATERILNRRPLQGLRLFEVLAGAQLYELFARCIRVVESGRPDKDEQFWDLGEVRGWFRTVAVKLGDGVALSFADITASKEMEDDLRRANAVKDEVLGLVSHELRAPLTTVVGIANVLERRMDSLEANTVRDLVSQLGRDARHLQGTIENMLLLARADAEAAETEPILAHRLAEAFVAEHNERHPEWPIAIDFEPNLPPVCGRRAWFEHVMNNLVGNATKYAPVGSEVTVRVRAVEGGIAVEVCDRGPGLDPEEIDEVFKPFFRSSRARARASGAGLGLAVCRRLVELQGGHIQALPREGGGLIVRFVLPAITEE